jgi:tetratricopeptide (TPR) repeat protein
MLLLTQCAVCATELGLTLGKKCGRCSTRYCGPACQEQHWKERGHDELCNKIKKAGGAEKYHADEKLKEAVAAAVEKCADDTKGQTCYICTQALHWKTKEGLVRGCSCRGTAGFAHVSCLAEQAKILVAEAEENNLDADVKFGRFCRWDLCSLCEQDYHGVVRCALGWACWKTYVGRPEADQVRHAAISVLGAGLQEAKLYEDALSVQEADLATRRRFGQSAYNILIAQGNLANTYAKFGRLEQALPLQRDVYLGTLKLCGNQHEETFRAANNYAANLVDLGRHAEAKALLRKMTPVARRVLGESHEITLHSRTIYAQALYADPDATLDDDREAVTTLEDAERTARRVLGGAHPNMAKIERSLQQARAILHAREGSVKSECELKKLCSTCSTSQPRSAFSGKQWKAKAAQRRCTQCIDNEAADAYAAAAGGV